MARKSAQAAAREEAQSEREYNQELIRRADVSRNARRVQCGSLRQWYEAGSPDGTAARYNKLQSHVDILASYLWSPDSVRFGVHLPPATRGLWLNAAGTARDEFRQTWSESGADLTVSLALEWALVYGAIPVKIQQSPARGFVLAPIDPWDFGITREDQPSLDDQDVYVHWYVLSMPQFERWCQGHPRETELIEMAARHTTQPPSGSGFTRLIISGVTGAFPSQTVAGSMPDEPSETFLLDAQVIEPVVRLADIWTRRTYHDAVAGPYQDWRVTTVLSDSIETLVRRRNPILPWMKTPAGGTMPAEHPFTIITPRPLPDYLWGRSQLAALLALQQWRESHLRRMDEVIQRQLDPSKFFSGVPDYEEAGRAMSTIGGKYGTSEPGAKMETIPVELKQEAFVLLGQIDSMFSDQAGIPSTLQGEQPTGVRAESQLLSLAGIGAGRVRRMALQFEQALSRIATLGFHILQRGDAQTYTAPDGMRFLLAQLPAGIALKVSAHSASPIFAEQTERKAKMLMEAGAIDGEWVAELIDPPYREEIKENARRMAQGRAEQQKALMDLALERIRRRVDRLGPGRPTGK